MTAFTRALRRKPARRIAIAGVATAGALVLAACSNGDGNDMGGMDHGSDSSASASAEPGKSDTAGSFNDADVTFAQSMIPHHKQAVEMSKLADGRASDSEVKKLAGQIEAAQDPEINTMTGWLKSWGKPTETESMPGMDHSGMEGMDGMMSDKDMKDLEGKKGKDFDRAFSEMMIEHHKGAITMAKDEQKNGKNGDAKKMAADIVKGQSTEVEQFQGILDRL